MRRVLLTIMLMCFSSSAVVGGGIRVIGKPVKLIGGDGDYFMNPLWSPDGSKIAFTGAGYEGLWVMNDDGTEAFEVSTESAAGFGFEWSSDSRAIIARVARYEGKYRYNAVKLFDIDRGETRLLMDYRTLMPGIPHWADGDSKVYMYGPDGLEVFESGIQNPAVEKTARSKQICFLKENKIAVGDVDTKAFTVFDPVEGQQYLNEVVSPDGSKIAFEVLGGNLFVMNIDGTGLVDLGVGNRPQWAPDNEHLVYMVAEDDGHQFTSSDIVVIKIDGSEKTKVTHTDDMLEMNPSWSPDGKRIAYDVMDEGAIYVIEVAIDASNLRARIER